MNKRKEFSKLNLLDRFLFDEAMEDSENMKTVLDIILGRISHLDCHHILKKKYGLFRITGRSD